MARRTVNAKKPADVMARVGQLLGQVVNGLDEASDDMGQASEALDEFIKATLSDEGADPGYAAEGARIVGVLEVRGDVLDQTVAHLNEIIEAIRDVFDVDIEAPESTEDDEADYDDVVREPGSRYVG